MVAGDLRRAGAASLAALALAAAAWGAEPYRRFVECEEMTVEGKGYVVRNDARYSGGALVQGGFGDEASSAKGGRLAFKLERTLPAGCYALWLRIKATGDTAKGPAEVEIEAALGASRGTVSVNRRSPKWHDSAAVIEARTPFDTVTLAVRTPSQPLWLDLFFLSSRPEDVSYDRTLKLWRLNDLKVPGMDAEAAPALDGGPEPPNWLANGSFEVGPGNYDWSARYQQCYAFRPEFWDETQGAEGPRSLALKLFPYERRWREDDPALPTQFNLMHRVLKLRPNATYFFRGLFRSDAPVTLTASAVMAYFDDDATAAKAPPIGTARAEIGPTWTPLEMRLKTGDNPPGVYLQFLAQAKGPATLWMDGLILSAAKPEGFVPAAEVEVGAHWTAPGKVFYLDEPALFTLLAWCAPSAREAAEVRLRARVMDYGDAVVQEEVTAGWRVTPGKTERRVLDVNRGKSGVFRLALDGEARVGGRTVALPPQEYVFCLLPRPPRQMAGTLGAYITVAPEPIEIMARAGIRTTTTLSCSNELLQVWSKMEPEPGKFIWADQRVAHAAAHDMRILANLDLAISRGRGAIPRFALDPADPEDAFTATGARMKEKVRFSKKAWASFVENVTRHYRGSIRDWLFIDEPYHYFKASEYAELLKVSFAAAKRGNPDCRVLTHGGYYSHWLPALEKAGAVGSFDGISDYARTPEQGRLLREFAARHGKFVRNVEYGWHASRYQWIETPDNPGNRRKPWWPGNTESVVAGALAAMCWAGGEGFGRYDARYPGGDFTQIDKFKSLFEYDGALKPPAVAYAIAAQLVDGLRGVDAPDLHPRLETFLLADDARWVLALRAREGALFEARLPLLPGVRALDLMGNPLPADRPALISSALVYLAGPREALDAARAALRALETSDFALIEAKSALDERTGHYTLRVTVTNPRKTPLAAGSVLAVADPGGGFGTVTLLRDVPAPQFTLPELKPDGRFDAEFALNRYRGDVLRARQALVTLRLPDGRTLRRRVPDLYGVSAPEPAVEEPAPGGGGD